MATRVWDGTDATTPNDWSVTGNWEDGTVPTTNDDVRIPAGSAAITAGLNQSAVAIGDFYIEPGYDQNIGSASGYLRIDPNRFEVSPVGGTQYIDIGSAAIDAQVHSTGSAGTGLHALYLKGSAIDDLSITSGSVGVAARGAETATVATLRVLQSAEVTVGVGTTLTTLRVLDGVVVLQAAATTVNIYGGEVRTEEEGAITTINGYGGTLTLNSTGTITTLNNFEATVDLLQTSIPRTISTYVFKGESGLGSLQYDSNFVTISTLTMPSHPVTVEVSSG